MAGIFPPDGPSEGNRSRFHPNTMTETPTVQAAVAANLLVLRQGIDLLRVIGPGRYRQRLPLVFAASMGGHFRHIIDHYQSFFAGLEDGGLNYEDRPRHGEVETNPDLAQRLLTAISGRLQALGADLETRTLAYHVETSPGRCAPSSVLRELEFLLSHTVHHYALVAVMCRLQNHEPETTFGVAPSTLRYQQSLAPCAP